jgi:hypothetical protein
MYLFVTSLFNEAVNNSDYIEVNNELDGMEKEAAMA